MDCFFRFTSYNQPGPHRDGVTRIRAAGRAHLNCGNILATQYHISPDKVLQFTNVARPFVIPHPDKQLLGKRWSGHRQLRAVTKPQILRDARQVLQTSPQWRHVDHNYHQAIEEIPSEVPELNFTSKVAGAGADDASISLAVYSRKFVGLGQRMRQLPLPKRGKFAYLLEKQGANT